MTKHFTICLLERRNFDRNGQNIPKSKTHSFKVSVSPASRISVAKSGVTFTIDSARIRPRGARAGEPILVGAGGAIVLEYAK